MVSVTSTLSPSPWQAEGAALVGFVPRRMGAMDPLLAHLMDIASSPVAGRLILTGGYGIQLKQSYLQENAIGTLIACASPVNFPGQLAKASQKQPARLFQ